MHTVFCKSFYKKEKLNALKSAIHFGHLDLIV